MRVSELVRETVWKRVANSVLVRGTVWKTVANTVEDVVTDSVEENLAKNVDNDSR